MRALLDILLERDPWQAEGDAIWDAHQRGRLTALVSAASLPILFYMMTRQADRTRAWTGVNRCVNDLVIVPVSQSTVATALLGPSNDFEDNLQLACAIEAQADALVTRDPKGFAGSPLPVLEPAALLSQLPSP